MSAIPPKDWFGLVEAELCSSGFVQKAALIDISSGALIAFSPPDFKVGKSEADALLKTLTRESEAVSVEVNGEKYQILRNTPRSLYARKRHACVTCVRTKLLLVVGVGDDTIIPSQCVTAVESFADSLIDERI
uniref:Profilin n=1 Tax=Palpitomonas bilix TaxID=652834 RepID=A0A7S3GKH7_9EUKA|mmetsp:Transcript_7327/g.19022  ORF Transcript_7327/g.19022 Transcript_7327/m.19022 type:complete len:133 (+) Transcript_7327:95-493(+)